MFWILDLGLVYTVPYIIRLRREKNMHINITMRIVLSPLQEPETSVLHDDDVDCFGCKKKYFIDLKTY